MNFSYSIRQPTVFGKYLLLDRVNIGGMAEVWRAKAFGAGGFERIVAIKRVLPNIARDPEFITMFIDEAKLTVNLTHANIAKIDELNHVGDSYYIAMEYVSGRDMRAVFEKFREQQEIAPVALTCFVLAACCEALDYAHRAKDSVGNELKVIHRDVSPQNILLSYEGEVKLIDFGIAKAAGKVNKTQAGILKGKFSYMSPEQVRGLPLDQRSDIFALGICLYEMLTGERLFTASTDFATLEAVRHAEIPLPSSRNSKVSPKLDEIVLKALSRNLDERYEWASELGQDLLTFMYSTGTPYTRKDLQAYMRSTFAEDYDRERSRLKEYAGIKAPPALGGTASLEGITTQAPASTSGIEPPTLGATVVTAVGQVGVPTLSPPFGDPARSPMEPPLEPTKRMNVPQEVAAAALTETPPHIEPPRPAPPSPRSSLRTPVPQARATAPAPKLKQRPPAPKLSPPVANLEKNSPTRRLVVPILVGATVVLLAGAVGFAVKLDKPTQGYVIIDIPQELRGKATLRIGASAPALQAENSWPVVRKVETGPVKVELSAPGYTSASHILYVREGESAALYEELKAAEASTSTR